MVRAAIPALCKSAAARLRRCKSCLVDHFMGGTGKFPTWRISQPSGNCGAIPQLSKISMRCSEAELRGTPIAMPADRGSRRPSASGLDLISGSLEPVWNSILSVRRNKQTRHPVTVEIAGAAPVTLATFVEYRWPFIRPWV